MTDNKEILKQINRSGVLESIEGLAEEEMNIAKSKGSNSHTRLFIFPAIVTNAEIAVYRFDPANIKINDGTLDVGYLEIQIVPFIRFRKSLATGFPQGSYSDLQLANRARERTVFVANAEYLNEFLKGRHLTPMDSFYGYAIQKLIRND